MDVAMDSASHINFDISSDLALTSTLSSRSIPSLDMSPAFRFYMILGYAQETLIDFLPITYKPNLGIIGTGATADIWQSSVNSQLNFAFKKISNDYILLNEIVILSFPRIRTHPHINSIEGLAWEVAEDGYMQPVIVFEKTELGDLYHFMSTVAGMKLSLMERWSLCTQISSAVTALHMASKFD
jgi:hypothetical protein